MYAEESATIYRSLSNMPLSVEMDGIRYTIYWARIINGKSESLLTTNTKHSIFEIEYAFKHSLTIQIGNEMTELDEGEFMIIPPETPHRITDSHPNGIKLICGFERSDRYFSYFKASLSVLQALKAGVTTQKLSEMLYDIYGKTAELEFIPEAAERLDNKNERRENKTLDFVLFSLLASFYEDASENGSEKEEIYSENEIRIKAFLKMVEDKNGVGITVSDAASYVNLSERQLFRICMSTMGKTPSEVINERKLSFLTFCLVFTPLNLTEIADLCGFQTEYAMAKFFKRYEKMNPSEYRKIHRHAEGSKA